MPPHRTGAATAKMANFNPKRFEPLYDTHPLTGAAIEVFYADRTLETFGRCGPGWFWWYRRRGASPCAPRIGPFATSTRLIVTRYMDRYSVGGTPIDKVNPDIVRTRAIRQSSELR
jgi:hypothetical protein